MGIGSQPKGLLRVRSFRAACSILRDVYCTRTAGHQGKGKIIPRVSLPTQGDTVSWWSSGKGASQGRWRRSTEFSRGSPHRTMPRLVTGGWSPHIWNHRWLWKPPFFHVLPLQLPLERYSIRQSHFRSSEPLGKEEKLFYFFNWLINLFILVVLGLHFCARAFSSCGKQGPLFIAVHGPFTVVASLVAEHSLQTPRISSCDSRA